MGGGDDTSPPYLTLTPREVAELFSVVEYLRDALAAQDERIALYERASTHLSVVERRTLVHALGGVVDPAPPATQRTPAGVESPP